MGSKRIRDDGVTNIPSHWHKEKGEGICSIMSDSGPARLLSPWDFPGKNIGVDCISFSRGSSRPRNRTHVCCIAGRFFITCTMLLQSICFQISQFKHCSIRGYHNILYRMTRRLWRCVNTLMIPSPFTHHCPAL